MEVRITNEKTMNNFNCSTTQPLNTSTSDGVAIRVDHVSKKFCKSLKRAMVYGVKDIGRNAIGLSSHSDRLRKDEFWAVDDVSFELKKGEILGIIGANGSGKTTLLQMLNGIFWPDKGKIMVNGRMGALIAVGAGFHPMLTGRENIYINGAILGMSKEELDEKYDDIIEFADIGDFIDTPVKFYSSGMYVRLGFAVAVHCEPDILLVDEILSVGDSSFRAKSARKMHDLIRADTSIVLVSHNAHIIKAVCDMILVLDKGKCQYIGGVEEGIRLYEKAMLNQRHRKYPVNPISQGPVSFRSVKLIDDNHNVVKEIKTDDPLTVSMVVESTERFVSPTVSIRLWRADGTTCWIESSEYHNFDLGVLEGTVKILCQIQKIQVVTGNYYFTMHVRDGTMHQGLASGVSDTFFVQSPVPLHDENVDIFHPLIKWSTGN